jgi:hypothetical protein
MPAYPLCQSSLPPYLLYVIPRHRVTSAASMMQVLYDDIFYLSLYAYMHELRAFICLSIYMWS